MEKKHDILRWLEQYPMNSESTPFLPREVRTPPRKPFGSSVASSVKSFTCSSVASSVYSSRCDSVASSIKKHSPYASSRYSVCTDSGISSDDQQSDVEGLASSVRHPQQYRNISSINYKMKRSHYHRPEILFDDDQFLLTGSASVSVVCSRLATAYVKSEKQVSIKIKSECNKSEERSDCHYHKMFSNIIPPTSSTVVKRKSQCNKSKERSDCHYHKKFSNIIPPTSSTVVKRKSQCNKSEESSDCHYDKKFSNIPPSVKFSPSDTRLFLSTQEQCMDVSLPHSSKTVLPFQTLDLGKVGGMHFKSIVKEYEDEMTMAVYKENIDRLLHESILRGSVRRETDHLLSLREVESVLPHDILKCALELDLEYQEDTCTSKKSWNRVITQFQRIEKAWGQHMSVDAEKRYAQAQFNSQKFRSGLMVNIVDHMTKCHATPVCEGSFVIAAYCATPSQIKAHVKNCTFNCCPVCSSAAQRKSNHSIGMIKKEHKCKSRTNDIIEDEALSICSTLKRIFKDDGKWGPSWTPTDVVDWMVFLLTKANQSQQLANQGVKDEICSMAGLSGEKIGTPVGNKIHRSAGFLHKEEALAPDTSCYYSCATEAHYDLLVSRPIDHRGGKLRITEVGAALTFPQNAVWGTIEASISTCSSDDDFPPMRLDQILMAMVMQCGPPGCFDKPVLLEIPHFANLEGECKGKDVEVWCKTTESVSKTGNDWVKVFADGSIDPDVDVTVLPDKLMISTRHFSIWSLLSGSPTDMSVLMFINPPTFSEPDAMVYLKVLVVLPMKVKQICDAEKEMNWHQCCSPTMYRVKPNSKPLRVTIRDISPLATWKCQGSKSLVRNAYEDEITYDYLQQGSAKCEFSFTKKKPSACHIRGSFNIHQDDNKFEVTKTHFDSKFIPLNIRDPRKRSSSGESRGEISYPINPPSVGSIGYMSASPGMSSGPGSVMSRPPPSVSPYMPPSVQSSNRDPQDQECMSPPSAKKVRRSLSVPQKKTRNHITRSQQATEEDSDDDVQYVVADDQGSYTGHHIEPAWPTKEQRFNKDNKYYNMNSRAKGLALVINVSKFDYGPSRAGSEVDVKNIHHLLEELGYQVTIRYDITAKQIIEAVKDFSAQCNEDRSNSAFVVMMGHGYSGCIYGSDYKAVKLKMIESYMDGNHCPSLKDKPKIFMYQTCRVPAHTHEEDGDDADDNGDGNKTDKINHLDSNEHLHMFRGYSTIDGYESLRHKQAGTWFIQALCEVFLKGADEDDLDSLFAQVINRVEKLKGKMVDLNGKEVSVQQVPVRYSTFKKVLLFLPGFPSTDLS